MRLLLIGVASALLVTACGQKGPLYFRDSPPPGTKLPKVETYKPVPYPKETEPETPETK